MKKFMFIAAFVFLCCFSEGVFAEDLTTLDGANYQNIRVSRIEVDGISFTHSWGAAKVLFSNLPESIARRYGYDPKRLEEWQRARDLTATQPQTVVEATAAAKTAEMTDTEWLEQGRNLLARRMFPEAVQWLEKPAQAITGIMDAFELDRLLRDAYAGWLENLQAARKQWLAQLQVVQEAVDVLKRERESTQESLNYKRATESQITQMSSGSDMSSFSQTPMRARYFRGSGDTHAAGTINGLEIQVMSLTAQLNKRTPELNQMKSQIAALDNQIIVVEARLEQLQPWYVRHWKWVTGGGIGVALLLLCVRKSPA
ncbi:MAG: hypothetical protein HZC54_10375 [Verrucomicrobia bacterium]|nr:hypothetical protein [Verrucomicrobiota bacterium]